MQKALLLFCFTFFSANVLIYAEDNILFSVGDTKVKTSEFEYIYKKNNFTNKADYSRKSLEDYLNLYVNFRLKVKEAISQGLDTNDRFKEELAMYEKQLLDSYVDKDILEKLVKQEFERSKTDVNISHIFFPSSGKESEADALAKAMETSVKLKSGTSFEEAAKISGDKQSADKGGNVGWFNSYQMTFPEMEAAVYSMKVGEVSAPVKTRAGFHILKLNATRPARPRIKAAIIKRFFPLADTSESAKKITEDSIRTAYAQLKSNMPIRTGGRALQRR
jgi:peptidyl-prolyl cis-trans isomerase SurA